MVFSRNNGFQYFIIGKSWFLIGTSWFLIETSRLFTGNSSIFIGRGPWSNSCWQCPPPGEADSREAGLENKKMAVNWLGKSWFLIGK